MNDEQDKSEFCCGYCGAPNPVLHPFKHQLPPDEWKYVEGPYVDGWWVDSEEEYLCMMCGSHLTTEEVYWGEAYKMLAREDDDE